MASVLPPIENLTDRFRTLPGIGRKTAARLALAFVDMTEEEAKAFAVAVLEVKSGVGRCPVCNNLCEAGKLCGICSDDSRDKSVICVVEDVRAVMAMERVRDYNGLYHVLGGVLSPLDGIGPEQLKLAELLERIRDNDVKEVIIATNPTPDGETTALYIAKLLKPAGIKTSRLAYGIPVGGDLEYADEMTLMRAMEGRRSIL